MLKKTELVLHVTFDGKVTTFSEIFRQHFFLEKVQDILKCKVNTKFTHGLDAMTPYGINISID